MASANGELAAIDAMIARMTEALARARATGQRREVFLFAYKFLSERLRENLQAHRFVDVPWTIALATRFAALYFDAETAYDRGEPCSEPWRRFFAACDQRFVSYPELLLLGMNAHIVYDLALALAPGLRPSDPADLALRQFDHELVNELLDEAIDPFQDEFARHFGAWIAVVDRLAGRLDEWLVDRALREVRGQVWKHAVALASAPDAASRETIRRHLERLAVRNARRIDVANHLPTPLARLARLVRQPL